MMGDSGDFSKQLNDSPAVAVTGKIMVAAIIILFLVIVFVLCLHLYAKYFWWRVGDPSENPSRRRRRFVHTPGQNLADVQSVRQGLDLSVLKSLPVTAFDPKDHKGLECAVCLSELREGEKARILPNCNHGFHVDCIDTWFQSHSTCPLCRNSVAAGDSNGVQLPSNENNTGAANNNAAEPWRFPTNILFWGNQTQVSSGVSNAEEGTSSSSSSRRPNGMLVIDISRSSTQETVETPSSTEAKSPIPTRLRSLTRLLSRGTVPPSPCSPSSVDIEQGAGRS